MNARRLLALALFLMAGWRVLADGAQLPRPERMVSDSAGVLSPGEVDQLEARLQRLRASGLAEAIIYIAPSLPQEAVLEELTFRSVNAWGIGDAKTNNGLAIFVFLEDRKVRIEVGLGLEGRVSDAAAAAIIEEQLAPSFRQKKFADGLNAATDRLEALIRP
ncbi:MAG TPA: TPM domain-containing protein [Thermoanaerobaculia bacterium]|nr:TPM domain-containing protein [Thermoanaerobaculia bacterium]